MTDEEIDAMEAGREMDALIAEKVMGWIWCVQVCTASPIRSELGKRSRFLGDSERYRGWHPKWDGVTKMPVDIHEESAFPDYSTDIAAAWQVVKKLQAQTLGADIHIEHLDGVWSVSTCHHKPTSTWADWADANTAPLAICRAALKCCKAVADKKVLGGAEDLLSKVIAKRN